VPRTQRYLSLVARENHQEILPKNPDDRKKKALAGQRITVDITVGNLRSPGPIIPVGDIHSKYTFSDHSHCSWPTLSVESVNQRQAGPYAENNREQTAKKRNNENRIQLRSHTKADPIVKRFGKLEEARG
jgi:hypothetical protein